MVAKHHTRKKMLSLPTVSTVSSWHSCLEMPTDTPCKFLEKEDSLVLPEAITGISERFNAGMCFLLQPQSHWVGGSCTAAGRDQPQQWLEARALIRQKADQSHNVASGQRQGL